MALDKFFAHIYMPIDCEFLVVQRSFGTDEEGVEFKITEVYHVHPSRALQIHRVGNWSSVNGLTWTNNPFYYRRRDLQGIVLKGAFIPDVSNTNVMSHFPCTMCQHDCICFTHKVFVEFRRNFEFCVWQDFSFFIYIRTERHKIKIAIKYPQNLHKFQVTQLLS